MRGSSNNPLRLVLLGAPGVGKGTQSQLLCTRLSIPHISTGDLLREAQHAGTRLGKVANAYIDRGELVPDQVITDAVELRLTAAGANTGFALDGFPRTCSQAERLASRLDNMGVSLSGVLYYQCPEEELVRRLSGRRICEGCGKIYHFESGETPPASCGVCGGRLYRREDDSPEAIRTRMRLYHEVTQPVADYYRERRILMPIEALGEVEEVYLRSIRALGLA
jgi:adenylate kinase